MPDRAQVLQELDRRGALPEKYRAEYEQIKAKGFIPPKGGFRAMSDSAATKLEEQVNAYAGLDRAVNAFQDDFSGPGSGIENVAQSLLGTGTPGQRDWWSDFRSSDNIVRNALFGASLTPSEQASYAATSVTPNMTPSEIRRNLTRRRDLALQMLDRRAAFARANGYTPEAVTAILGEYDPAKRPVEGKDLEPFSVEGLVDRAAGLRGGKAGEVEDLPDGGVRVPMPDGTYNQFASREDYDRSNAERELANAFGGDRTNDAYRAAYRERFGEAPPLDVDVEGGSAGPVRGRGAAGDGLDAFVRGVADTATFGLADELEAGRRTLFEGGSLAQSLREQRAIDGYDNERHFGARTAGQIGGALVVPYGAGARTAPQLARVGALGGGAYGFGSGQGNVLERMPDALSGAAIGGIGGYALGRAAPVAANALARFRPGASLGRVEANALAQAGERQKVPMTAADLRPGARNMTAYLEASPGGSGPVQDALSAGNDALEAAVGRVGGGTAQSAEAMGRTVQDAGRRMIERTRVVKNDLYAEAERLAPTATVRSQSAVDAIDRNIAELSETPNANRGLLSLLQDMRNDLVVADGSSGRFVPRGLTVGSIRNLRTAMRGEIGSRNLTMTDAERRVSQVIDAASNDIAETLARTDSRAAAAYRRADQFYGERQRYIRDVVQHYTGPRDRPYSGEQTYQRLLALTNEKGDRQRLAAVMRGLNADERADIASTVASSLGRRAADDDFSAARFITQARKMTAGAREAIFGREGAEAVDDLIRIATAKRDTGNSLNRSRSGQVGNYDRWLTGGFSLLGAGGGYAAGGAGGAALGAVTAGAAKAGALNLSARLLTNPAFVGWLGRAPRNATPAQIEGHVRRLSEIAIRQPAIRGEIQQLQRLMSESGTARPWASEGRERDDEQRDRHQPMAAVR